MVSKKLNAPRRSGRRKPGSSSRIPKSPAALDQLTALYACSLNQIRYHARNSDGGAYETLARGRHIRRQSRAHNQPKRQSLCPAYDEHDAYRATAALRCTTQEDKNQSANQHRNHKIPANDCVANTPNAYFCCDCAIDGTV